MKLIHVKQARSIWLFDLRDLNPKGKDVMDDIVGWIKDTYGFAVAPNPENPIPTNPPNPINPTATIPGLVFQRGNFQAREEMFVEISVLTLYNDGIVVDTPSSTHDADLFAKHLLETAAREFTLNYEPEMIRRRIYVSELIVRSDIALDLLNPKLTAFASRITEAFPDNTKPEFRIAGLSFWSEPNDSGFHKIFTLERQATRFFAEKRYYSQAPVQTNDHLRLLEELERAIMGA